MSQWPPAWHKALAVNDSAQWPPDGGGNSDPPGVSDRAPGGVTWEEQLSAVTRGHAGRRLTECEKRCLLFLPLTAVQILYHIFRVLPIQLEKVKWMVIYRSLIKNGKMDLCLHVCKFTQETQYSFCLNWTWCLKNSFFINYHFEHKNKQNRDRLIDGEQLTASGWWEGGV